MPLSSDLLNVIENFNAQQNHFFCEKLTQIIYSRHVKNGDCVIDCGANQGLHTRELSRLVGETGIVHAFEPNPDLIKILLNINSNVRVWPFAAGDTLDIVRLHVPTGLEGWASLHDIRPILQNYQFKLFSTIQVDLNRLDEIHERPVRFVKLDVERHELAALKGMDRILQKSKPMIVLEGCNAHIEQFLGNLGYKLINLIGTGTYAEKPNLPNSIALHENDIGDFHNNIQPSDNDLVSLANTSLQK